METIPPIAKIPPPTIGTKPEPTNIPPDRHWGCASQMIYDRERHLLISLISTRYSLPNDEHGLYIYTADPDEVMGDPDEPRRAPAPGNPSKRRAPR